MAHTVSFNEVQLGAQGRLVIPAALRKALNLNQGDCLVVRKEDDSLILERREAGRVPFVGNVSPNPAKSQPCG